MDTRIISPRAPLDRKAQLQEIARVSRRGFGLAYAITEIAAWFNLQAAARAKVEAERLEERERYARAKGLSDYESWLAAQRDSFIENARAAFDAAQPPIHVPERIEPDEVREVFALAIAEKAKKGAAA